jgi:hypothetical protein
LIVVVHFISHSFQLEYTFDPFHDYDFPLYLLTLIQKSQYLRKREMQAKRTPVILHKMDIYDDDNGDPHRSNDEEQNGDELSHIKDSVTQNSNPKSVRFHGKDSAEHSDFSVSNSDPDDSDELKNYKRHPSASVGNNYPNTRSDEEEQRDMIIGGKCKYCYAN